MVQDALRRFRHLLSVWEFVAISLRELNKSDESTVTFIFFKPYSCGAQSLCQTDNHTTFSLFTRLRIFNFAGPKSNKV